MCLVTMCLRWSLWAKSSMKNTTSNKWLIRSWPVSCMIYFRVVISKKSLIQSILYSRKNTEKHLCLESRLLLCLNYALVSSYKYPQCDSSPERKQIDQFIVNGHGAPISLFPNPDNSSCHLLVTSERKWSTSTAIVPKVGHFVPRSDAESMVVLWSISAVD